MRMVFLSPRVRIENLPEGPLAAGNSLNEAKRAIDGLESGPHHGPPVPEHSGPRPTRRKNRSTPPKRATPPPSNVPHAELYPSSTGNPAPGAGEPILNALRDRIAQDGQSVRRIARFLSVHSGVILEWLAGTRKPRPVTLERIAAYLKGPVT